MKYLFNARLNLFYVLGAYFFICGFTSHELSMIESALLKKDYVKVEELSSMLVSSASSSEIRNQANYYLAVSKIQSAKYSEAKEILQKLINGSLASSLKNKVYLALFDAYYLDEDYFRAQETIQKLLKQNPSSDYLSLIYLKIARVSLKLAQWEQAREYLNNIVTRFPNSFEVYPAKQLLDEKQYFAVQVGSFAQRDGAEKIVSDLKQKGEYAYIVETSDQDHKKFYRVRVGQIALLDEARKLKKELSKLGYPTQIFP